MPLAIGNAIKEKEILGKNILLKKKGMKQIKETGERVGIKTENIEEKKEN